MNRRSLLALPVVLVALTSCATTVTGHGRPGAAVAAPGASGSPTTTGSPTGGSTDDLASRLEAAPAGSKPWGDAWSDNATPTTAEFVDHVYAAADRSTAQAKLEAQGITGIAHRTWYAADADQADDVLLRFDSSDGAKSRFRSATSAQGDGRTAVTVAGLPDARGFSDAGLDSLGNVRTIFYLQRGAVVVELFYYSPATYRADDAAAWLTAQAALL